MTSTSLYADHERFRARRERLLAMDPESLRSCILIDGMFAIGVLMGGDFIGAAAVLSVILEREFPEQVNFGQGEPP